MDHETRIIEAMEELEGGMVDLGRARSSDRLSRERLLRQVIGRLRRVEVQLEDALSLEEQRQH